VYDLTGELDGRRGNENPGGALFPYLNHRPSLETELGTFENIVGGRRSGDRTERRVPSVVGHVIFPFRAAMLGDDNRSEYVHAP